MRKDCLQAIRPFPVPNPCGGTIAAGASLRSGPGLGPFGGPPIAATLDLIKPGETMRVLPRRYGANRPRPGVPAGERGYGHCVSRNPGRARPCLGTELHPWDGRTSRRLGTTGRGADAVVNLVGENLATADGHPRAKNASWKAGPWRSCPSRPSAARHKPRVFVRSSAVGYYGTQRETALETRPPGNDFLAQVCAAWEASTSEVEPMGVRRVVTRSAVVLAAGGAFLPLYFQTRLFVGGRLGSGRQPFPGFTSPTSSRPRVSF